MQPDNRHMPDTTSPDGRQQLLIEHIRNVYDQFEDKLAQLSILRELGMILLYINDFKNVCRTILEIIINNTVAKNCSIMLMDHDQNRLFLIATTNAEGESYFADAKTIFSKHNLRYTFEPYERAARKAVIAKGPILIEDVDQSDIYALHEESRLTLSGPSHYRGYCLGCVNIKSFCQRCF